MARALFVSLLVLLALSSVPSLALAQDAGTGQYHDPLPSGGSNHPPRGGTSSPPPAVAAVQPSQASQSSRATGSSGSASSGTASTTSSSLPRSGFPTGLLVLAGAVFLAAGLALRRVAASARI